MPKTRDLTQEQTDWLLAHPRLTALIDRLLAESPDAEEHLERPDGG